jgi:hypothetical protein
MANAVDIEGSSDHPMLTRFPGSIIVGYDQRYHDQGWLPDGSESGRWVAGLLTWIVYDVPDGHSSLEIYRNYENALIEGGFSIGYNCKKEHCGRKFVEDLLEATGRMVGNGERWLPGTERHLSAEKAEDSGRHIWANLTAYERNREGDIRVRLEIIEENLPRGLAGLPSERLAGNSLKYDEVVLPTGGAIKYKLPNVLELEGSVDWSVAKYPSPASAYELFASTRKTLREQEYTVDFQCHLNGCGKYFARELIKLNNHPLPRGEKWSRDSVHYLLARKTTPAGLSYVSAAAYMHPEGYAKLRRIEVATTDMEFNLISVTGESLADELEASGKVAVYGLYFDTDSADLKPESDQTLGEIAAMLHQRPDITLYVDGHTDSEGEDTYNQDLSARRAQAVVSWLIAKGVAGARLQSRGFGEAQPVADNETEEGRTWNRRVELVARQAPSAP